MNSTSPAFGISRGRSKVKISSHSNNHHYTPPVSKQQTQSQPHAKTTSPKIIQNINPNVLKAPIGDLHSSLYSRGQVGDIVFNSTNRMMYYNNGSEWVPMSGSDSDRSSVTSDTPKDNPNGPGEDLTISSGCGCTRDGRVHLQSGNEDRVVIGDIVTVMSDLSVEGAIKRKIDTCLATQMGKFEDGGKTSQLIGFDESDQESIKDEQTDGETEEPTVEDHLDDTIDPYLSEISFENTACRVNASVVLKGGQMITGDIINPHITKNTIMSATVSTDSGVPLVWFGKNGDGTVKMHLRCLEGELSELVVFISIEN